MKIQFCGSYQVSTCRNSIVRPVSIQVTSSAQVFSWKYLNITMQHLEMVVRNKNATTSCFKALGFFLTS